jgi:hypothetical protein
VGESAAWDAYLTAEIRIEAPGGPVRVFASPPLQASGRYPDPEGRPIAVITAHNPGGVAAADEANEKAQRALEAELDRRGIAWWPADGADPEWSHVEASVAVPGMSEADALALGAEFGQEAVFLLTQASRKVVACATGRRTITGWTIVGEAELEADPHDIDDEVAHLLEHLAGEHGPDPARWPGALLAESRWDVPQSPGDGTAEDAGTDSRGDAAEPEVTGEFLLRVGGRYVLYETNGPEWDFEVLDAPDDAAAVAAFRTATGA